MVPQSLTENIPDHLKPYIVKQDPSLYTPIDHASWRFILKISKAYFAKHAHQKYLDGLNETGISTERIPLIEEMDHCLRKFNWRAVAVSGFIPPSVFMEYLSLGVLTIACDMRQLEHLAYTPAPDIVHEAAGHAPIIADPEYREYLRSYGETSRKAIYSKQDMDVYHAIRRLSETKEDPKASHAAIEQAQRQLDRALAAVDHISEAAELARMGWWTFEYGLIGDMKNPKIYGAGLLSSVGESYHCLSEDVKKIPFSVDCVDISYDITRPQPQLFVARDFKTLEKGLQDLANTMAFRRGGIEGLEKAKKAGATTTTVLDSGIQISGTLVSILTYKDGKPSYLRYEGPTQLSFEDQEIAGQGPKHHSQGFSTPIGLVADLGKSASELTSSDLNAMGFASGAKGRLKFQSGITLEGKFKGAEKRAGKNLILSFEDCTVKQGDTVLFQPDWGTFDMACGDQVTSVFGGAADRKTFLEETGGLEQKPRSQKGNLTEENRPLLPLYAKAREIRESKKADTKALSMIHEELEKKFPNDWLLRLELLEMDSLFQLKAAWTGEVRARLQKISEQSKTHQELIQRGLEAL